MDAKTLTVRLSASEASQLEGLMKTYEVKTATGMLRKLITDCKDNERRVLEAESKAAKCENIIAGLANSADTLKDVIRIIDQGTLEL